MAIKFEADNGVKVKIGGENVDNVLGVTVSFKQGYDTTWVRPTNELVFNGKVIDYDSVARYHNNGYLFIEIYIDESDVNAIKFIAGHWNDRTWRLNLVRDDERTSGWASVDSMNLNAGGLCAVTFRLKSYRTDDIGARQWESV